MRQPTTLERDADAVIGVLNDAPDESKPLTPERAMWLSVVALCWNDAWGITPDAQIRYSDSRFRRDESTMLDENDTAISVEAYRASCRNWLFQDFGKWKADREFVADLSGLDPDVLRTQAKAKLREVKQAEAEGRTAKVVALDTLFAQLLDAETSGVNPDEISRELLKLCQLEAA